MAFCNACGRVINAGILCGACEGPKKPAGPRPLLPPSSSRGLNRAVKITAITFGAICLIGLLIPKRAQERALQRRSAVSAKKDADRAVFYAPTMDPRSTAGSSRLSKASFDRISTGMSYPQVVAVIGEPGEEISRMELAGRVTVMYSWNRFTDGNLSAMFHDGKLISKAQSGLR